MLAERDREDWVQQTLLAEPRLANVTEEGVATALEGFRLTPVQDIAWLTKGIKVALRTALDPIGEGADAQENKVTKRELLRAAGRAEKLSRLLAERTEAADDALLDYSNFIWGKPPSGGLIGESPAYRAFQDALNGLDRMAAMLRGAAGHLKKQGQRWKQAVERSQRVRRAYCLSPIFELAFDEAATVNNWEGAASLGAWPDFHQRIMELAFGERVTFDRIKLLQEARRLHLAHRVSYAEVFGIN